MSVLHERIMTQGTGGPQYAHPGGTRATPMVMPLAVVHYEDMMASYHDLHAYGATGDVNAVPMAVTAPGTFGKVVPSGRP